MKSPFVSLPVRLILFVTAALLVAALAPGELRAFNPQPDPPAEVAFGLIGLTMTQTADRHRPRASTSPAWSTLGE